MIKGLRLSDWLVAYDIDLKWCILIVGRHLGNVITLLNYSLTFAFFKELRLPLQSQMPSSGFQ